MNNKSAAKIKLNSFDDLFGSAPTPTDETTTVREIPLSELYEFKNHPFKVLDDSKMQETVESIRNYGVLMPGIARPRAEGGYEIIAGHRRKHGCELAGLSTIPMFIRNYSDDEATIIMVDTNIQREDISHSEKAKAYKMKYEAIKHQGKKGNGSSLAEVGKNANDNAKKVQRYIWLARLTDELLDMVDKGQLDFMAGVYISFLSVNKQQMLMKVLKDINKKINVIQAEQLKWLEQNNQLTSVKMYEICRGKAAASVIHPVAPSHKSIPDSSPVSPAQQAIDTTVSQITEPPKEPEKVKTTEQLPDEQATPLRGQIKISDYPGIVPKQELLDKMSKSETGYDFAEASSYTLQDVEIQIAKCEAELHVMKENEMNAPIVFITQMRLDALRLLKGAVKR